MLRLPVLLLALLVLGVASAQASPPTAAGPIIEVRVEGTTQYADIVRTIVAARVGSDASRVDLEAERNRIYTIGTFEEVSVAIEDRGAGPLLIIRVRENPPVAAVEVIGSDLLNNDQLRDAIVTEHLLDTGRTLNTLRAERAIATLQAIFRSIGMPYDVDVTLEVLQAADADRTNGRTPVRVRYAIDESAPLRAVVFEPSAIISDDELQSLAVRLRASETFNFQLYRALVDQIGERYRETGLRQSGVDLEQSSLDNGLLTVRFRELRIAAFDTVALGIDASSLSLAVGDLFNYDQLLEDVRRLAVGRSADVRIDTLATATGAVRVRFVVGAPETAGPVREIVIEGNTRVPEAQLLGLLSLTVGDTFSSLLAEEDFRRIRAAYDSIGVVIEGRPAFEYRAGVYIQRITEMVIAGYDLVYDGETGRTQDRVITRYLPAPGEVVDLRAVDNGLRQVARLGVVTPVNRVLVPTGELGSVRVEVVLRSNTSGLLQPGAQYSTATGLSGSVTYSESNLWGLAHNVSAELSVLNSDLGLVFGAGARYSIPWLDIDFLDFREVPTSLSVGLFTRVDVNQPLSAEGSFTVAYPGLDPDVAENQVRVGEYLVRSTGASFSVGRRVLPFTDLVLSGRATRDIYTLEPVAEACAIEAGTVSNGADCALPAEEALAYLPQGGLNAFVSAGLGFDNRDSADFPREGVAANVSFGYGWGNDMADPISGAPLPYSYTQTQAGVRTYLALADVIEGFDDRNHVFAVRLNVGAQFGETYPENRRFRVGNVQNPATEIRGYRDTDFDPSRSYVTSSVEYRYDFALDTFATQTVVGIVFVDLGYVPSVQERDPNASPVAASIGAGVQINLGFAGVALPALRFDYGFSERNTSGVFSFRVGSVF